MTTFCTVCAAANPAKLERCRGCGAPLSRARAIGRRAGRRDWAQRLHLVLMAVLPATMLLAGGGYWLADRTAKAAAYERGETAFAQGDPEAAIAAFADAGGYRDAPVRHASLQDALAPYRALYQAGVAALSSGDLDGAIAALLPVVRAFPGYRDATVLLAEARVQQEAALESDFAAAQERGDWLVAERVLARLVALDPADEARAAELTRFRREHAPLVFARDEALYLAAPTSADGWRLPVDLPAAWPVWSPDRSRIAFVSHGDDGQLALYVVSVDGTGLIRLGERLRLYEPPVWSPDGTRIAFLSTAALDGLDLTVDPAVAAVSASVPGAARATPLREPALRVVEVATGRIVDPTGGAVSSVMSPSWSPYGDRLAFVSRSADELDQRYDDVPGGELLVVDLATGAITRPDNGRISFPWRLAWSPGREALIVWARAPGQAYDLDRVPLYLVDVTTGSVTDLNPNRASVSMAVWSPDGVSFAYLEDWDRLRIRSLSGEDRSVPLAENGTEFISWSPDGTALIVAGGGRPSQIVTLSGDGAGVPIAFPLDYDTTRRLAGPPSWAPLNPVPDPRPPSIGGTAWDAAR